MISTNLRAAIAMLAEGKSFPCHICDHEPDGMADLDACSMGRAMVDAEGAEFRAERGGWIECLAIEFDRELVITKPSYLPIYIRTGQRAKVGKLTLDPKLTRQ